MEFTLPWVHGFVHFGRDKWENHSEKDAQSPEQYSCEWQVLWWKWTGDLLRNSHLMWWLGTDQINQSKECISVGTFLPEINEKCDPPHGSKARDCRGDVSWAERIDTSPGSIHRSQSWNSLAEQPCCSLFSRGCWKPGQNYICDGIFLQGDLGDISDEILESSLFCSLNYIISYMQKWSGIIRITQEL